MSTKSEYGSVQSRRIERLERRCKQLEAGASALETVVLRYGAHTLECGARDLGTACFCDWDSTREMVEAGRQQREPLVSL